MTKRKRRHKNNLQHSIRYFYLLIAIILIIVLSLRFSHRNPLQVSKIETVANDEPSPAVEFHFYSSLPNMKIKIPTPKKPAQLAISNVQELEQDVSQHLRSRPKKP